MFVFSLLQTLIEAVPQIQFIMWKALLCRYKQTYCESKYQKERNVVFSYYGLFKGKINIYGKMYWLFLVKICHEM